MLRLIEQLGTIADRPEDSPEERTRKRILIYAGLLMSGGGVLWGSITAGFGLYKEALVPFGYVAITGVNYLALERTRRFAPARAVQISISLLLPLGPRLLLQEQHRV